MTQQRGGLECFRFRIILNDPVRGVEPGDHRFRYMNARNWVSHFPLYIEKYWEFLEEVQTGGTVWDIQALLCV